MMTSFRADQGLRLRCFAVRFRVTNRGTSVQYEQSLSRIRVVARVCECVTFCVSVAMIGVPGVQATLLYGVVGLGLHQGHDIRLWCSCGYG